MFAFTGFRQVNGQWLRTDVELQQTWFDQEAVVTILQESQLGDITVYDAAEVLGNPPAAKRLVYRATA